MPVFAGFLFLLVSLAVTMGLLNKRQSISKKAAEQENNLSQSDYTKILPLANKDPLYKFSVDGKVELNSNSSFLRIILVDDEKNEYLVYETDVLLADSNSFSVVDACVETCVLNGITSDFLRVEGNRSTFELSKTNVFTNAEQLSSSLGTADFTAKAQEIKKQKENLKIEKLKEGIKKKGMNWVAGETSVSKLSYAEKKKLFPNPDGSPITSLPNLQGFEYYKGGVFEIMSDDPLPTSTLQSSLLPTSWDWRDVHGENWNTAVKNQGNAGTCWAFADVGVEESQINLYFNQHLNPDLSEQMYVDCGNFSQRPIGMSRDSYYDECRCDVNGSGFVSDMCVFSVHGIPEEACDPYVADAVRASCDNTQVCADWQNRIWKNTGNIMFWIHHSLPNEREQCNTLVTNPSEDHVKRMLIQKGPMSSGILSWPHAMILEGYETDPVDGKTIWIFKNSWGETSGEGGYAKIKVELNEDEINMGDIPLGPFTPPTDHSFWPSGFDNQIKCVDKDNDTYCNWGISEVKPSTCPSFCKVEKDCNDANAALGSFDQNYNCLPAVPTPTPVYPGCSNFRIANPVVQKGFFNPLSWTRGANTGLAAVFIRKKNTDNTWGSWQHLITSLADGWSTYTAPNEIGTYEVGVNVYDADCNDKWLCAREAGDQGWTTKLYSVTACPTDGTSTIDSTKSVLTNVCMNTCRGTFEVVATLTPTPVPVTLPRITTATLPDGTLNKWYQQNIVATDIGVDETLTMKVIFGLPNALWLGTGQCSQSVVAGKKQISCPVRGYPRQTGTFGIGVSVKDNFGNVGRRTVTLIIR